MTIVKTFCLGFTERDSSRVTIQGVDPEALTILIDYVYTSHVYWQHERNSFSRLIFAKSLVVRT